jgi:hypothetical protein
MRLLSKSHANMLLILTLPLVLAIFYFVGGIYLTAPREGSLDQGWLVVALAIFLGISNIRRLRKFSASDMAVLFWPVIAGFVLEWLSDVSTRNFQLHDTSQAHILAVILPCTFLVFIISTTIYSRLGVGAEGLAARDTRVLQGVIWLSASATTIYIIFGATMILVRGVVELSAWLTVFESWLYRASLIVFFLLTIRMVLPLFLRSVRVAFSRRDVGI